MNILSYIFTLHQYTSHVHLQMQKYTYSFYICTHRFLTILCRCQRAFNNIASRQVFYIFTFESLVKQCKCIATRGYFLISKRIKSLCGFTNIFIYVNVSTFVYKVYFGHYFLGKASPQTSVNSILRIIFPDSMDFAMLVYVRH